MYGAQLCCPCVQAPRASFSPVPGPAGQPQALHQGISIKAVDAAHDKEHSMIIKSGMALAPGDVFTQWVADAAVEVTVVSGPTPHTDRFGRDMVKYTASRSDTGAQGYIIYGPGSLV